MAAMLTCVVYGAAFAQGAAAPEQRQTEPVAETSPAPGQTLWGDTLGFRSALSRVGIEPGLLLQYEYFRNPVGGFAQVGNADGLAVMSTAVDLQKLLGLAGARARISAFGIFGRGITASGVGSLGAVSSNEAFAGLRLNELWIEQDFWGGRGSLRLGQQAADLEFLTADTARLFLNAAFGWPNLPSIDLPASGPSYPLATPGARLRVVPGFGMTALLGIYGGDPSLPGLYDRRVQTDGGVAFRTNDGALLLAELQRKIALQSGDRLQGTLKIGAWYDTDKFFDQRFDAAGVSLARPGSTGVARSYWGTWSVYGVWDQTVWQDGDDKAVNAFVRIFAAPEDRNLVSLEINPGIAVKGVVPNRPADVIGFGYVYTRVSGQAQAFDRDLNAVGDVRQPVRGAEQGMELTYQAPIRPWLILQPDLQYFVDPGRHVPNPAAPSRPVDDAFVFGLRASVNF